MSWIRPIGVWSPGNIRPWVWSNDGWMHDPQFRLDTFGASTCPRATIHFITFILMPLFTAYYIRVSITAWILFLKGLSEVKSAKDSILRRYSGSYSCIFAHGQRSSAVMASNDLWEIHVHYIELLSLSESTLYVEKIFKKSLMRIKLATVKATGLHIKTGS